MANRRIRSVSDITEKLQWYTNAINDDLLQKQLCRFRILRWLNGKGHPAGLRGTLVDNTSFDAEANDPILRAKLFLASISDSDLLNLEPSFKVRSYPIGRKSRFISSFSRYIWTLPLPPSPMTKPLRFPFTLVTQG